MYDFGDHFDYNDFVNYEKPSEGALATDDIFNSHTEFLCNKLDQLGLNIRMCLLPKGCVENENIFTKETVNERMGDIHYFTGILRDLVHECIALEKKAGLRETECTIAAGK